MKEQEGTTPETRGAETVAEPTRAPADQRPRRPAPPKPRRRRGITVNDPVGDMLTRLRNAVGARHETVEVPTSKLKNEIAKILHSEGYISGVDASGRALVLRLKYVGKTPVLTGIQRVSRPGRRVYAQRTEMPRVLGGLGIAIVSTSAGVMTGSNARRRHLGGEILAQVW